MAESVPSIPMEEFSAVKGSPLTTADVDIDLQSDSASVPSPEMYDSMVTAELSVDCMESNTATEELEGYMADLFGMEASLWTPTCIMANLIAVMIHCEERGSSMIVGNQSHIYSCEQGGASLFGGVHPCPVQNLPDGTFSLAEAELLIKGSDPVLLFPVTKLICIENTHTSCGGKVLSMKFIHQVHELSTKYNLKLHMDGARIMNAVTTLGKSPKEFGHLMDSISICFSKGIGAPSGGILLGNKEFITKAKKLRKLLGGAVNKTGVLAAAALYGMKYNVPTMVQDHLFAAELADLFNTEQQTFLLRVDRPDSNVILVLFEDPSVVSSYQFSDRLKKVSDDELAALQQKVIVRAVPLFSDRILRFVTHVGLTKTKMEAIKKKLCYVIKEFQDAIH